MFLSQVFLYLGHTFKIVDRIFIHNRETKEVVLEDYYHSYGKYYRSYTHLYIFKFKNSSDLYSTGMLRQRILL